MKKYYRFAQKVLSFCPKSTIVLPKKYYRFYEKVLSFSAKGTIEAHSSVVWNFIETHISGSISQVKSTLY